MKLGPKCINRDVYMHGHTSLDMDTDTNTDTHIVSHRHQGQVPLDFITVEGQAHVVSQLLEVRVQAWENRKWRYGFLLAFPLNCSTEHR